MTASQAKALQTIDKSIWFASSKQHSSNARIGNQPIIMVNAQGDRLSIIGDGSVLINGIKSL
jgi:hypothetical protein